MDSTQLKAYLVADLRRNSEVISLYKFLINYLSRPTFKYTVWLRLCSYVQQQKGLKLVYLFFAWNLQRLRIKYGIHIFSSTKIGSGFLIGHMGGIVVNSEAVIGMNCTILHDVTIGVSDIVGEQAAPVIGDNVYLGSGARIIGPVKVGDNVVVGANCVVVKDVPENAVVIGVPARIVSYAGANRSAYNPTKRELIA